VVAAGISAWFTFQYSSRGRRDLVNELAQSRQRQQQLSRERDEALRRAEKLSARTEPAQPQNAPLLNPDTRERQVRELRQALETTQRQLTAAQQSLDRSQAEVAQVRAQLDAQEVQITRLHSEQATLRDRASQAESQQRQTRERAQALESRLSTLESERTRLLNVIQMRQRESEQSLRMISYLTSPGTRLIELRGTESAPSARGYLLVNRNTQILLSETGLPALSSGRIYQLWLIRSRGEPVVSGGLFTGDGAGAPRQVEFNSGNLIQDLNAVAVTEEPSGGSKLPTGHKLLIGTVQS
jgi:phage shock protein A